MIVKNILENLEEYVDIACSDDRCSFYNKNTKICLFPNIEEFGTVISSNFNSNEIRISDVSKCEFDSFIIVSEELTSKLREKIKGKIERAIEKKKILSMPTEDKNEYFKDKFVNKFITERE